MKKVLGAALLAGTVAMMPNLAQAAPKAIPPPPRGWVVTGVGDEYQTLGAWHDCTYIYPSGITDWGCNTTYTAGNTVTGSLGISDGLLSEVLGYAINRSYSIAAVGSTDDVAPEEKAWLQYTTVYGTQQVVQKYEISHQPTGQTDIAYGHQRQGVTFQVYMVDSGVVTVSAPGFKNSSHIIKCIANCG